MGRKEFNEHLDELLIIKKYVWGLNGGDQLFKKNTKEQMLNNLEQKIQDLKRGVFNGVQTMELI